MKNRENSGKVTALKADKSWIDYTALTKTRYCSYAGPALSGPKRSLGPARYVPVFTSLMVTHEKQRNSETITSLTSSKPIKVRLIIEH